MPRDQDTTTQECFDGEKSYLFKSTALLTSSLYPDWTSFGQLFNKEALIIDKSSV